MDWLAGQCGTEKSGNYLLYRILRSLLECEARWSSYSEEVGCWKSLFEKNDVELSFPELDSYDEFRIESDDTLYHLNSHFKASIAVWNIEQYDGDASVLWTHQKPMLSHHSKFKQPRRWFYIIRDGRAVVNSWMHYAVSPRMLKRHPQYAITHVEDLYRDLDYFEKAVIRWVEHVEAYLDLAQYYQRIHFEDLVSNRSKWIYKISELLDIQSQNAIDKTIKVSDFQRTKQDAPNHARLGGNSDWSQFFKAEHKDIYQRLTTTVIKKLAYTPYQSEP